MRINHSVRLVAIGSLLALMLLVPASSFAGVFISVGFGPPALPVYAQPPCPAPGYLWTPGYWAYGPEGYFWVPGTWVVAPQPGLLWTPGYWGWGGSAFLWHAGFWGPTIGFYGGINYGYGYGGVGYQGGYWRNGGFFYNRSVNNVNTTNVTNVYNTTVVNNTTVNHVSYNGGTGGITARPTPAEQTAAREKHIAPTAMQTRHETTAASNRQLLASVNHGRPAIAATAKPAEFSGRGVVAAKQAGAPYKAPPARGAEQARTNNAVPRPGNGNNVGRPATTERGTASAQNSVPRPPQTANKETTTKVERTSGPATVPRPTNTPRPNVSQPSNQARTETAARQPAPRPDVAPRVATPHASAPPRPQSAPRPQVAPRSAPPANEHRAPEPRQEGHPKGRP
jgi:hypothetical protein